MLDSDIHLLNNWGLNKKILQTTQLNRLKYLHTRHYQSTHYLKAMQFTSVLKLA